jgi:hypothetical protein
MKRRQKATSDSSPERRKFGGVHVSEACGCTIVGFGTPEQPWRIAYCDAHKAVNPVDLSRHPGHEPRPDEFDGAGTS